MTKEEWKKRGICDTNFIKQFSTFQRNDMCFVLKHLLFVGEGEQYLDLVLSKMHILLQNSDYYYVNEHNLDEKMMQLLVQQKRLILLSKTIDDNVISFYPNGEASFSCGELFYFQEFIDFVIMYQIKRQMKKLSFKGLKKLELVFLKEKESEFVSYWNLAKNKHSNWMEEYSYRQKVQNLQRILANEKTPLN